MENWLPIKGFEGYYEVSDKGIIRSVDRIINHKQGPMKRKGVVLLPRKLRGYDAVCLRKDDERSDMLVHRAVAQAFCSGSGDQVRHLDGNKENNHASNLLWGTAKENAEDRDFHGTTAKGENHPRAVINEATVKAIRKLQAAGYGPTEIGRRVGMNKSRVHEVMKGKTWKHVF